MTVKFPAADFPVFPTARIVYVPARAVAATVNPTFTFPAPVIVHDAEDRIPAGEEVSIHAVSVANPLAVPTTTVPLRPDVGVSVKVPTGPVITENVALAESVGPAFVSAVTV